MRKRQEARATQEADHDEAQQAAEEQQLQRSAKVRRSSSKEKAVNQDGAEQHRQGDSERRKSKPPQHKVWHLEYYTARSRKTTGTRIR